MPMAILVFFGSLKKNSHNLLLMEGREGGFVFKWYKKELGDMGG